MKALAGFAGLAVGADIVGADQVEPVAVDGEELDPVAPGEKHALPGHEERRAIQPQQRRSFVAVTRFPLLVEEVALYQQRAGAFEVFDAELVGCGPARLLQADLQHADGVFELVCGRGVHRAVTEQAQLA